MKVILENYKGFEIESEYVEGYLLYNIIKDGEYVKQWLVSKHACKCWITKELKGE